MSCLIGGVVHHVTDGTVWIFICQFMENGLFVGNAVALLMLAVKHLIGFPERLSADIVPDHVQLQISKDAARDCVSVSKAGD